MARSGGRLVDREHIAPDRTLKEVKMDPLRFAPLKGASRRWLSLEDLEERDHEQLDVAEEREPALPRPPESGPLAQFGDVLARSRTLSA